MIDFVFSKEKKEPGYCTKLFNKIYFISYKIKEFSGTWGTLAVSYLEQQENMFYEDDEHLIFIVGQPILKDTKEAIYRKIIKCQIAWDEDIDGTYLVFHLDKKSQKLKLVTDLLSFIPVYINEDQLAMSTHLDVLAEVTNKTTDIDEVSEADFILNGTVTYPYTMFNDIIQLPASSEHRIDIKKDTIESSYYWKPYERIEYLNIKRTARKVRGVLEGNIQKKCAPSDKVAHFISGGEDSRLLAALLKNIETRDAIVFLDEMNREGRVAEKAANIYGSKFNLFERNKDYYLSILPDASSLIGSNFLYVHAHSIGFVDSANLNTYQVVLGGLFSDALLKGSRIQKKRLSERFDFLPQKKSKNPSILNDFNSLFSEQIIKKLNHRRKKHLELLKSIRPNSAEEWFYLWPITMNDTSTNIHVNRRLFNSYEPFLSNEIVKISASVPMEWKLNRRLFHAISKPYLKRSKNLMHADGRLPYYPWYLNSILQLSIRLVRRGARKIGAIEGNQGPWGSYDDLLKSKEVNLFLEEFAADKEIKSIAGDVDFYNLIKEPGLTRKQKLSLLQVIFNNYNRKK